MTTETPATTPKANFIRTIIAQDIEQGRFASRVHTRFPPEPNGYLHIGHAKSICLNFGLAEEFSGKCNLRFDDTNPAKESEEYVASIIRDVAWLGFDASQPLYASDYFEQFYQCALQLIRQGQAYVCHLSGEETRRYRGTLTEPGQPSPYRERTVDENLALFDGMKQGKFAEGECVLRAKIDMASPNLNLRDPIMYRISYAPHHRTGTTWCIYPMYDYAHGLEDSIEGITHSICTLEFEDHRPLYDWFLDALGVHHPQQIEFARLNLTTTLMSKRKLLKLVEEGHVSGWDDPRMPTIAGLRRRGYTPAAIRRFAEEIGVAKSNSTVEFGQLEFCLREDLNRHARRVMVVLNPVKLVITNYPENQVEWLDADNNPENPDDGKRQIPFCREVYIERDDFMEVPTKGYHRLSPGKELRLKHAYYVLCEHVVKDAAGNITEIHCTYDPASRGGWTDDGRKVKGTAHWVSAAHAVRLDVRLYDHLFTQDDPENVAAGGDFTANLNPNSLCVVQALGEPELATPEQGRAYQFLRHGYFCADPDTAPGQPVFNRTVGLKSSWKG